MDHETHGMEPTFTATKFANLNVKGGSFDKTTAAADKALAAFAPLKTGGSSSIKKTSKVAIPKGQDDVF